MSEDDTIETEEPECYICESKNFMEDYAGPYYYLGHRICLLCHDVIYDGD